MPGGLIRPGFLAIAYVNIVYSARYTCPAHAPAVTLHLPLTAPSPKLVEGALIFAHVTRDVSEAWWDSVRGMPLQDAPPDSRDLKAFDKWATDYWRRALDKYEPGARPRRSLIARVPPGPGRPELPQSREALEVVRTGPNSEPPVATMREPPPGPRRRLSAVSRLQLVL